MPPLEYGHDKTRLLKLARQKRQAIHAGNDLVLRLTSRPRKPHTSKKPRLAARRRARQVAPVNFTKLLPVPKG